MYTGGILTKSLDNGRASEEWSKWLMIDVLLQFTECIHVCPHFSLGRNNIQEEETREVGILCTLLQL